LGQADFIPWEAHMTLKTVKLALKECAHDAAAPYHRFADFPLSFGVEALRWRPTAPRTLYWAPKIPIQTTVLGGNAVRYIKTGRGPNLVLLHTLRTQLDIFEKLVPLLSKSFTVYALDYPGHGFSDIPKTDYNPDLFVKTVEGFLEKLDLKDITLAGISIGGVIPLIVAANHNPRVKRVISINPYDYGHGMGIARGNGWAWLTFNLARVPVLGETIMRLRNRFIEQRILQGGVANSEAITQGFGAQVRASGFKARPLSRLPQPPSPCTYVG
jgi:pimeloyl-ACP methyl ester carboxylesterase